MLYFSKANTKLKRLEKVIKGKVYSFDLLSGHTCPFAKDCKSMAIVQSDGRLKVCDGPNTVFRCFSATQEAMWKCVFDKRAMNTKICQSAKTIAQLVDALSEALPMDAKAIRLHVAGDFFNKDYLTAWCYVAENFPDIRFYGYTKCIPFVIALRHIIPDNMKLVLSSGGTADKDISIAKAYGFYEAIVVYYEKQAEALSLEIDHNDYHAYEPTKDFALLIHGTQPKNTLAGKAVWKARHDSRRNKTSQ